MQFYPILVKRKFWSDNWFRRYDIKRRNEWRFTFYIISSKPIVWSELSLNQNWVELLGLTLSNCKLHPQISAYRNRRCFMFTALRLWCLKQKFKKIQLWTKFEETIVRKLLIIFQISIPNFINIQKIILIFFKFFFAWPISTTRTRSSGRTQPDTARCGRTKFC